MRDRVTISLYSVETNDPPGYKEGFLNEFANIKKIRDGLVVAAKKAGRESPEFVVSILLVPNWDRDGNSYDDQTYLRRKSYLFIHAKHIFEAIPDVKVEDFYSDCVMLPEHRAYLHGLKAMGSNADMIKTIAIVNNCDRIRHLQIDSNTVVPDFEELYRKTFSAETQKDGVNASYYDDLYISAHNKMVYTAPDGDLAKKGRLHTRLWEWCKDHGNDSQDKQADKNSIYARVFCEALHDIGYVKSYDIGNGKFRYPATLSPRVYWLTDCMTTAIQMSWKSTQLTGVAEELKTLPNIPFGSDGTFNIQCFANIIKKHTGMLNQHSIMLGLTDTTPTGEESRKRLLNISNTILELQTVKRYFENTIHNFPSKAYELSRLFPNSALGNILTQRLFGSDVMELQEQARAISIAAMHTPVNTDSSLGNESGKAKESTTTNRRGLGM